MSATAPTVASTLSDDLQKSRRTAYRKYAELLSADAAPAAAVSGDAAGAGAGTAPDAKSMTQLRALASSLGRSPADVESDARVLRAAQQTRARIDRARGSYAAQLAARPALAAHVAETAKLAAARDAEYRALYAVYESHGLRNRSGRDALVDLNALIDRHPELLAHLDRATDHDLV